MVVTTLASVHSALPALPVVAFDSFFSPEIESILLQNRQAARLATKHLLDHDYKSVVCVYAKPNIFSYQERTAGYADAMTAYGLTPTYLTADDYSELELQIRNQFTLKERPEALLALSDITVLTVLRILRESDETDASHT